MHTVFALLCFVVVIHWLIFPYPSGLLHWHCGNLTIAPVPAKQPWWIWINTSCEFIMNDLHNHNKAKHNKTVCIFLGIYCSWGFYMPLYYKALSCQIVEWIRNYHDDVIKWKHFPRNCPFVRETRRSPGNFPHKGQWRGALMFSLIYTWINDWVNNREAGDLRRQHGHYDVIVMYNGVQTVSWFKWK